MRLFQKTIFLSILLVSSLFFAPQAFAGLYVVVAPNPTADNYQTALMVFGCPDGDVKFSWKKNNTRSATVTSSNGLAVYQHPDYDPGTYNLTVECGGQKATSAFSSAKVGDKGWWVTTSDGGGQVCKEVSYFNKDYYVFNSPDVCNAYLTQIRSLLGNTWYHDITGGCTERRLLPPSSRTPAGGYYPSKQACIDSQSTSRYEITYLVGIATCSPAENGPYTYKECQAALANNLAWHIFQPPSPYATAYCEQVKKDKASSGEKLYNTKEDCNRALTASIKWKYNNPEQIPSGNKVCYQTTIGGGYDTELECNAAFCKSIEQNKSIYGSIYDTYCSKVEELISPSPESPTPTPLPPRPPCKKGLKYNFDINNPYTKPADTTTNNAKIDLCTDYNSAFGTISTDTSKFVKKFFAILLSLSGGIVLLLLIYSGYQILTSQGNADRLKAARERITSAIIGLLFMIFSLVILQVIGVDILNLPGFAR